MRLKLFLFFIIVLPAYCIAQDTIFVKNGQVIPAIIIEKNNTEIKYRRFGPPESAAIYSIFVSDISSIHYKDGIIADYSQVGVAVPGEKPLPGLARGRGPDGRAATAPRAAECRTKGRNTA